MGKSLRSTATKTPPQRPVWKPTGRFRTMNTLVIFSPFIRRVQRAPFVRS